MRVRELVERRTWARRYSTINRFEEQLAASGTLVVKCFLHISPEEQRERLLARLDDPTKHWKYRPGDLDDRALWGDFQQAYGDAIERCNTDAAPWYVVPADRKWYRNWAISNLLIERLEALGLGWPRGGLRRRASRRRVAGGAAAGRRSGAAEADAQAARGLSAERHARRARAALARPRPACRAASASVARSALDRDGLAAVGRAERAEPRSPAEEDRQAVGVAGERVELHARRRSAAGGSVSVALRSDPTASRNSPAMLTIPARGDVDGVAEEVARAAVDEDRARARPARELRPRALRHELAPAAAACAAARTSAPRRSAGRRGSDRCRCARS